MSVNEYHVIESIHKNVFEEEVTRHLNEDWFLVGGVCVTGEVYAQAVQRISAAPQHRTLGPREVAK